MFNYKRSPQHPLRSTSTRSGLPQYELLSDPPSSTDFDYSRATVKILLGSDIMGSQMSRLFREKKVRCMPYGSGGTLKLVGDHQNRESVEPNDAKLRVFFLGDYIGVQECKETVGVYFEIGENLCFCANISARARRDAILSKPRERDYERIVEAVAEKLEQHRQSQGWRVRDVKINTLVLACARPEFGGEAVIQGIHHFLAVGSDLNDTRNRFHGFVVEPGSRPHTKGRLPYVRRRYEEEFEQLRGFEMCEEGFTLSKEWCYSIQGGWAKRVERRWV